MINEFRNEYLFLSNFYPFVGKQRAPVAPPAPILWKGHTYLTAEHLYQRAKTTVPDQIARIRRAESPALAKYLGKGCTLRPDWNEIKLSVMEQIVTAKFVQNTYLALKLLRTGSEELAEGNWWGDTFWGVDLKTRPACGHNHLGKIHMKVRKLLTH